MKYLPAILFFVFSAEALVLDWSGSYEAEMVLLQSTAGEPGGRFAGTVHNLKLKPDIKIFDGLKVKGWFQLASLPTAESAQGLKFYPQGGPSFGTGSQNVFPAYLELRDLYMESAHTGGLFRLGWKPHHFGLGMYYHSGSNFFDPVYNLEGSRGMLSWQIFAGSYYIQPMVHYVDNLLFNVFIQAGWQKKDYGVEAFYKAGGLGEQNDSSSAENTEDYIGVYAYFTKKVWDIKAEGGRLSDEGRHSYAGAVQADWQSPWEYMSLGLNLVFSPLSQEGSRVFYVDPNYSSDMSFLISFYSGVKDGETKYLKTSGSYAFHEALFLKPSVSFVLSDTVSLKGRFLAQLLQPAEAESFYGAEFIVGWASDKGFEWNTLLGFLGPSKNSWQIGFGTQVVFSF